MGKKKIGKYLLGRLLECDREEKMEGKQIDIKPKNIQEVITDTGGELESQWKGSN